MSASERMLAVSPTERLKNALKGRNHHKVWFSSPAARRLYGQVLEEFDESNREYNETIDRLTHQLSELKISSKIDLTLALEKQRKDIKTETEIADQNEKLKLEQTIENLNMNVICLKRRAGILEDAHQLYADTVQKSMSLHIETIQIMKLGFDSTIKRLLTLISECPELNDDANPTTTMDNSDCTATGLSNREKLLQGLCPGKNSEKTSATLLKLKRLLLAVHPDHSESKTNNDENTLENPLTDRPTTPDTVDVVVEEVREVSTNTENSRSNSESTEEETFEVFTPRTVRNLKRLFSMIDSD